MQNDYIGENRSDFVEATAKPRNRFATTTYWLFAIGLLLASTLVWVYPLGTILIAAILCGWSELDGYCGTSHICTITPMKNQPGDKSLWFKAVSAYTLGGVMTAAFMGMLLGGMGLLLTIGATLSGVAAVALAIVLIARELDIFRFNLPQIYRQTNKMWAFEFGYVEGAFMWGSDIGLGVATVIAHGGFFVLILLTMQLGPWTGALLYTTYWIGRTLPIWIAPKLFNVSNDGGLILDSIMVPTSAFRHIAALGLFCFAIGAIAIALQQ